MKNKYSTGVKAEKEIEALSRDKEFFLSKCPFVPDKGKSKNPGTISFPKGRYKTGEDVLKQEKYVLKQEKYILKQEKMFENRKS